MSVGETSKEQKGAGESSKRAPSRKLRILGLFVFLPLLFFTFWSGLALQIWRTFFPYVYYSESFADITVEGQRYQLTSVAKCEQRYTATAGGLVHGGSYHTVRGGLLVKRLPSGAGIIIKGPYLCSKFDKRVLDQNAGEKVLELAKFLPKRIDSRQALVLRLDNAEKPSRITGYWKAYFGQPTAQIQIHRIGFRETDKTNLTEPTEEIPWLKGRPTQLLGKCSNEKRFEWVGFYLDVAKEEVWSKFDKLKYLYSKKGITEMKYSDDTEQIYRNILKNKDRYNIDINIKEKTIDLDSLNVSEIGMVKHYLSSNFKNNQIYTHKFFFIQNSNNVKNNQKLMYYPSGKYIFYLHKKYFSISSLCR